MRLNFICHRETEFLSAYKTISRMSEIMIKLTLERKLTIRISYNWYTKRKKIRAIFNYYNSGIHP